MRSRILTILFIGLLLGIVAFIFLNASPRPIQQVPPTIPTVQQPDNKAIQKITKKISRRVSKNKGVIISFKDSLSINPKIFFEENKQTFGLSEYDEMRLISKNDKIAEYQQYYKDFKVNGHIYRIGFDSNNFAFQASGSIIENIDLKINPNIKEKRAFQVAIDSINNFYRKQGKVDVIKYSWEDNKTDINSHRPIGDLFIGRKRFTTFEPENYTLFYSFNITTVSPDRNIYTIYVDAQTGVIDLFKDAIVR